MVFRVKDIEKEMKEHAYLVFRTSLFKLFTVRFFIFFISVLMPMVVLLMLTSEVLGMKFLIDVMNENSLLITLFILLIAIHLNFFLFNYTFKVGNGHVIVYRFSFRGKKKIGEYTHKDHFLSFEEVRGTKGGTVRFFLVKPKEGKKEKRLPHGLSKRKTAAMRTAINNLSKGNSSSKVTYRDGRYNGTV